MFGRKKIKGLEAIPDGIEQVQLFICPNCGRKCRDKPSYKCAVCGMVACLNCHRELRTNFGNDSYFELQLCRKHFNWLSSEIKKLVSLKRKDKTDETIE